MASRVDRLRHLTETATLHAASQLSLSHPQTTPACVPPASRLQLVGPHVRTYTTRDAHTCAARRSRTPPRTERTSHSHRRAFQVAAHGCYICWPLLDPSHDDVRADDRRRHTAAGPTDGRASGAAVRAGGPRRRRRSLHVEDVTLATPAAGRPAVQQQHHHPHPHHRFTGPQKRTRFS